MVEIGEVIEVGEVIKYNYGYYDYYEKENCISFNLLPSYSYTFF